MDNKPILIGFSGPKGVGKTSLARAVHEVFGPGAVIASFAGPIKEMLGCVIGARAMTNEKDSKPEELCGKSVRHALQTLGTEWGREMIGPDVWLRVCRSRWRSLRAHGDAVFVDDVRFANESEAIRDDGGFVIDVRRAGFSASLDAHASEAGLPESCYDGYVTLQPGLDNVIVASGVLGMLGVGTRREVVA